MKRYCAISYTLSATSTDGINWSTFAVPSGNWARIKWFPQIGLFIATGQYTPLMTSPDGENWTVRTVPIATDVCRDMIWSDAVSKVIVLTSDPNNATISSPDGINWTAHNSGSNGSICLSYSPELNLFIRGGDSLIQRSVDGINWSGSTSTGYDSVFYAAWSPKLHLFVTVAPNSSCIYTSYNGVNWTKSTPMSMNQVVWSDELEAFISSSSNNGIIISKNGFDWEFVDNFPAFRPSALYWSKHTSALLISANYAWYGYNMMINKVGV